MPADFPVNVQFIAMHVACLACGATSRLTMSDQVKDWCAAHFVPAITHAELFVNGQHRRVPVVNS